MKFFFSTFLLVTLFAMYCPDKVFSANENQLVTELIAINNDTSFRHLYLYDNTGNKVLETLYYKNESDWVRKAQKEWLYNAGKCIMQRERIWKNGEWVVTYLIDYEYVDGLLGRELHKSYPNKIETLIREIAYSYKSSRKMDSYKQYDYVNGELKQVINNEFSYSNSGKIDSVLTTVGTTGSIISQYLSVFSYNLNNTISTQLLKQKNPNEDWANIEFINWYYKPGSAQIVSQRSKKWNSDISNWENSQRIDYVYNQSNQLLSETYQCWKAMFWNNDVRYEYQYENGKQIRKTLTMPIYNAWRNVISIQYSAFSGDKPGFMESQYNFWGGNTGEYTTSHIPFFFNNEVEIHKAKSIRISYLPVVDTSAPALLDTSKNNFIRIYPNPSVGIYYADFQKYKIESWTVLDVHGRILKTMVQHLASGVIDITELPKGIYMLKVKTDTDQFIQKLIKE